MQLQSENKPIITPLYIPCLQPLQLTSSSPLPPANNRHIALAPLTSPHKRVSAKKTMRCCRQLFSPDAPSRRTAAMDFWLEQMEQVGGDH